MVVSAGCVSFHEKVPHLESAAGVMVVDNSCAGAVHGWLPAKRARLPLTSIFVEAGLTLLSSENESVHVPFVSEYVVTDMLETRSMANVPVVVWFGDTTRCPGFGFVFCAVTTYVCALEYPDFVTVIWYAPVVVAPINDAVPSVFVKVVKSMAWLGGVVPVFTM